MTVASAMQTFLVSPITSSKVVKVGKFFPANVSQRSRFSPVRSMPEGDQTKPPINSESEYPKAEAATPKLQPPRAPKVSTKFGDVLAFSGPAPERINGRLAMIGFVAAMAVEVAKGQDLFSQLSDGGVGWFVGTSVLLSLASLVPLFKGVTVESKSDGIMTSNAELWNGRVAMLGLVALAFTEFVKGSALV